MKSLEAWTIIIKNLENKNIRLMEYPKLSTNAKFFYVSSDGLRLIFDNKVYVDYKQFEKIFPYYFKKERINNIEDICWEYQYYIFSVIKNICFLQKNNTEVFEE